MSSTHTVTIDSTHFPDQDPSHLRIHLSEPLRFPRLDYEVGLIKLEMTYSVFNVTDTSFTMLYLTPSLVLEIVAYSPGIYTIEALNERLHDVMRLNGDLTYDSNGDEVFYISFEPNYVTGRVDLSIYDGWSIDFDTMSPLLGFNTGYLTGSVSSDYETITSPSLADINNGLTALQVRSNLASNSFVNGEITSVLYNFVPTSRPYMKFVVEPNQPSFTQVTSSNIDLIELFLTNQDGNQVSLNERPIKYTLQFRPISLLA